MIKLADVRTTSYLSPYDYKITTIKNNCYCNSNHLLPSTGIHGVTRMPAFF